MKIDLHSHSTVSDGLDSPTALVALMAEAGLTSLALTDHDTLQGLPEARAEAHRRGVELISGAEISAEWGGQDDIHILALFVDENNARFNAALAGRQEERRTRGERMARRLVEAGYAIDLDAIRADVGDGVWGRPHLARALIRAGYAASNDEAFDRFLGREHPWYVPYKKWKAAEVVAAIREAGGVSSLAHAVWYKDADALVRALAAAGLDAIEVFHPDHDDTNVRHAKQLARDLDLMVTGSSDYHGTGKQDHDLGCKTTSPEAYAELVSRLEARSALVPRG